MAQQSSWRGSHRGEGAVAMSSSSRIRSTPPISNVTREPMVEEVNGDSSPFLLKSEFADAMATFKNEVTGDVLSAIGAKTESLVSSLHGSVQKQFEAQNARINVMESEGHNIRHEVGKLQKEVKSIRQELASDSQAS
eukprot:762807-Karenia_brevis.AAC.1